MDLWPKSLPAHQHPKGFICLWKDLAARGPGSPRHLPHPSVPRVTLQTPHGLLQHLPLPLWLDCGRVPKQDTLPVAHIPWKGVLRDS